MGITTLLKPVPTHGDAALYPATSGSRPGRSGLGRSPLDNNGNITYSVPSDLPGGSCYKPTSLFPDLCQGFLPATVDQFEVRFEKVDDGARLCFAQKCPDGEYVPNTDVVFGGRQDRRPLQPCRAGETNRVVNRSGRRLSVENNLRNANYMSAAPSPTGNPQVGLNHADAEVVAGCTQDDFLASARWRKAAARSP